MSTKLRRTLSAPLLTGALALAGTPLLASPASAVVPTVPGLGCVVNATQTSAAAVAPSRSRTSGTSPRRSTCRRAAPGVAARPDQRSAPDRRPADRHPDLAARQHHHADQWQRRRERQRLRRHLVAGRRRCHLGGGLGHGDVVHERRHGTAARARGGPLGSARRGRQRQLGAHRLRHRGHERRIAGGLDAGYATRTGGALDTRTIGTGSEPGAEVMPGPPQTFSYEVTDAPAGSLEDVTALLDINGAAHTVAASLISPSGRDVTLTRANGGIFSVFNGGTLLDNHAAVLPLLGRFPTSWAWCSRCPCRRPRSRCPPWPATRSRASGSSRCRTSAHCRSRSTAGVWT